jgi:hypothetical protein
MRQIQIRFGRYQLGQNPNRASLFCAREVLGNYRGQSQQSRVELGLRCNSGRVLAKRDYLKSQFLCWYFSETNGIKVSPGGDM